MAKKLTKRDHFTNLLTLAEVKANPELVKFIEHEIELLAKKNGSEKKPTAQQEANERIKADILATMEEGKLYTITELMKVVPSCADLTNQRVSALVRQMLNISIERIEDKRKAYFRKIG